MKMDEKGMRQMEEDREHQDYRLEKIMLNFTAEICARMEEININRAELAKRLGRSRAFVSKIMACSHNITLKTLDSIAHAVGMEIDVPVHVMRSIEEELLGREKADLRIIDTLMHRVAVNNVKAGGEAQETLLGYEQIGNFRPSKIGKKEMECGNDYDYSSAA